MYNNLKTVTTTAIAFLIIFLGMIPSIQAQDQEPLVDEMRNLLKSDAFNVGLLQQSTFNYSLTDDGFNNGRRFGLGATRLRFGGNLDGGFSYVMQMDFRRAPGVIDAAIGYRASEQFAVVTGLQKPDIGLDLQPNPGNTDFISRARLVGTMLNVREVGVSVQGQLNGFDYNVAVFNGTGLNFNSNDDRFMYLAKVGYRPDIDQNGTLYIGANGALNTTQNESVGNTGFTSAEDRLTYGLFADYRGDSWFGAAEFMQTKFETFTNNDETITSFYVTIGNKVTEKSEFLGRWDHLNFDLTDRTSNLFILGWNYQATSVISFQVNALADIDDNDERFGLAGSFQFQF